ncbi:hypothetical protein ACPV5G_21490, partial [Photobacterium damselae]|uniref:hypothetical protein n=1 Tax=Photobacterium damselae TaxID=38293 RepID=UPI0040692B05
RGGIAKNVARFEKQVAAQIQAKGLDGNQSGSPVEKTLPPSTSDDSGTYSQNGKDGNLQDNNLPEEPSAKSHANPLIDKAKAVINDTLVENQGGLKGVRKAYRGAGITANQVNDAVISAGIADNVS